MREGFQNLKMRRSHRHAITISVRRLAIEGTRPWVWKARSIPDGNRIFDPVISRIGSRGGGRPLASSVARHLYNTIQKK